MNPSWHSSSSSSSSADDGRLSPELRPPAIAPHQSARWRRSSSTDDGRSSPELWPPAIPPTGPYRQSTPDFVHSGSHTSSGSGGGPGSITINGGGQVYSALDNDTMSRVLVGNTSIHPEGAYFVFIERITRDTDGREVHTSGYYRTNQPPTAEGPLSEALRDEGSEILVSWEVRYCHRTELGRALRDYNERHGPLPLFGHIVRGDNGDREVDTGDDESGSEDSGDDEAEGHRAFSLPSRRSSPDDVIVDVRDPSSDDVMVDLSRPRPSSPYDTNPPRSPWSGT